ncbi:MAG: hypothetical protein AAFR04_12140 [Pseudomonadota bacterium]
MALIETNAALREQIRSFLQWRRQEVTFVELLRFVPALKGEHDYLYPGFDTIVLWRGLSIDGIDALTIMVEDGEVDLQPTSTLTYVFFDGYRSRLPIANARRRYRTLRWWPMTLALRETDVEAAQIAVSRALAQGE